MGNADPKSSHTQSGMIPGCYRKQQLCMSACIHTQHTADPSSSLKLVNSRRRRPHSQGRANLTGCCGELVCSLWPGEQRSEILMSVLLTGLYQVSTNCMKLMERVCHDSLGFNALSPAITTTVSHTQTLTHTDARLHTDTQGHSPRCNSKV